MGIKLPVDLPLWYGTLTLLRGCVFSESKCNGILIFHVMKGWRKTQNINLVFWYLLPSFQRLPVVVVKKLPANAADIRDTSSIPRSGRSLVGEGMAVRSSILAWRIPMDSGAWWTTVHITPHILWCHHLRPPFKEGCVCFCFHVWKGCPLRYLQ